MDCFSLGGMVESTLNSWEEAPWPKENILHENPGFAVIKDGFPVTEGHLLFVPKTRDHVNIVQCFGAAYTWGNKGVNNGDYEGYNIGYNNSTVAGQTVFWPHIHLIPRRKGDVKDPRGGIRHVIPRKGNYKV